MCVRERERERKRERDKGSYITYAVIIFAEVGGTRSESSVRVHGSKKATLTCRCKTIYFFFFPVLVFLFKAPFVELTFPYNSPA